MDDSISSRAATIVSVTLFKRIFIECSAARRERKTLLCASASSGRLWPRATYLVIVVLVRVVAGKVSTGYIVFNAFAVLTQHLRPLPRL